MSRAADSFQPSTDRSLAQPLTCGPTSARFRNIDDTAAVRAWPRQLKTHCTGCFHHTPCLERMNMEGIHQQDPPRLGNQYSDDTFLREQLQRLVPATYLPDVHADLGGVFETIASICALVAHRVGVSRGGCARMARAVVTGRATALAVPMCSQNALAGAWRQTSRSWESEQRYHDILVHTQGSSRTVAHLGTLGRHTD